MEYCGLAIHRLPDIAMYGGDTTPWVVTLVNEDGTNFSEAGESSYECILSITPFAHMYGSGNYASSAAPMLTKTAAVSQAGNAYIATFAFITEDTIQLRGKYTYQIEVRSGIGNKVSQGNLTILENKNRKVGA